MSTGSGPMRTRVDFSPGVEKPGPTLSEEDIETLFLIRDFERTLLDLFAKGLVNGTTHTCLGQEYIPVALSTLFRKSDFIFSNHRGHGHYLARFRDPEGLLLEILGREGAVCKGVGGSQHIFRDGFLSTGVLGQSVAAAAGMAWSLKRRCNGNIAIVYMGDGGLGEGAVYEALNMASLWKLPLLICVENNGVAQSSEAKNYRAGTIGDRALAFGVRAVTVAGCDLATIRARVGPEIDGMRVDPRPLLVELVTQRLAAHSKGDDDRDPELLERLWDRDWEKPMRAAYPEQCERIAARVRTQMEALVESAMKKPPAEWSDAD